MPKSKGKKHKTRSKLRKNIREKGKVSATRAIQKFPKDSKVSIRIDSSVSKGQPHPKFHGKTGTVQGKQGRAYVIDIKDGNKVKNIISRPEHLTKVET